MNPALRYHGSKYRLAPWLLSYFPAHRCYVEPYAGAAGVLLQKPRSAIEIYNDLDCEIVNFFRVLREPNMAERLIEQLELTPFARAEFNVILTSSSDDVERARLLAVRAFMGFGSSGATMQKNGMSIHGARVQGWRNYPQKLHAVVQRLQGVVIENRDALSVMRQHDSHDTLHFVDPPYLPETRKNNNDVYRYEMTLEQHADLLQCLNQVTGMVILCGYPNDMYDQHLPGWETATRKSAISGNRGGRYRIEKIWMNQMAVKTMHQKSFGQFNGNAGHATESMGKAA